MWLVITMMVIIVVMVVVVVSIRILVKTLFSMKDQEVHAERIEGSDEHTSHNSEVSKPGRWQMAEVNRFNDAVFGIKTRKQWSTDQSQ
jgi:uncharacterized membrane protein